LKILQLEWKKQDDLFSSSIFPCLYLSTS
jgi:hypothetical protein